jgi:ADP-heptose:LPS heptosyltransferase
MSRSAKILVLKFGALGDFVQAFAAFAPIRRAHPDARITLLTTPPFAELAQASGLFDRIEIDGRPESFGARLMMLRRLRREHYDRVYDLQTSGRSTRMYYWLWPRPPEWSGIAAGSSLRQRRPDRDAMHNLDRMADQLHVAGIAPAYPNGTAPIPDLSFAAGLRGSDGLSAPERLGLSPPYALLAPGASAVKPEKLWPVRHYAELAARLQAKGYQIAVIGGPAEAALYDQILRRAPGALDLIGKTSLLDLASLGAGAALAIGNDSGPTHLLAYSGARGAMLMSRVSDPEHCGPRSKMISLRVDDLADLTVDAVLDALAL